MKDFFFIIPESVFIIHIAINVRRNRTKQLTEQQLYYRVVEETETVPYPSKIIVLNSA